ncbi:hypothetical protein ABZP36_034710 [Zizania latifolia]
MPPGRKTPASTRKAADPWGSRALARQVLHCVDLVHDGGDFGSLFCQFCLKAYRKWWRRYGQRTSLVSWKPQSNSGNFFQMMEAAWVLTNIAASDYTLLVAECGVVPRLVDLLGSPNANIRHQATWALGNIAADMPSYRETVLDNGAVTVL